jgi:hypothetical protein
MRNALLATALTAALTLQACSSRPREFSPNLASVPADQQAFETAHAECRQLLADGKLDSNGMLASTGAGAAAGATTMAVGAGAAATAGGFGGLALASATIVALPFAMVGGAYWMAKSKRNKKERKIQQATAGCLVERGFPIVGWEPTKKRKAGAAKRRAAAQAHSD